jgi:hypothetical protein
MLDIGSTIKNSHNFKDVPVWGYIHFGMENHLGAVYVMVQGAYRIHMTDRHVKASSALLVEKFSKSVDDTYWVDKVKIL